MSHLNIGNDLQIPLSWKELTVGQFLQVLAIKDEAVISEITELLNDQTDLQSLPMPEKYNLGGKPYDIPKDLNTETYGQKIFFEHKVFECIEKTGDVVEMMDEALGIYFYPQVMGKAFDDKDLHEVTKLVRESNLFEAYPIASFFLRSYLKSLKLKERV